jgi:hypothetical protein
VDGRVGACRAYSFATPPLALGAPPLAVVPLVQARVALLVGAGLVVGAGASLWASWFVVSLSTT